MPRKLATGKETMSGASDSGEGLDDELQTCNICLKTYKSRFALKRHWLTHIQGAAYKCQQCQKEYMLRGCFLNHVRTKHASAARPSAGGRYELRRSSVDGSKRYRLACRESTRKSRPRKRQPTEKKDDSEPDERKCERQTWSAAMDNTTTTLGMKCGVCSWRSASCSDLSAHLRSHASREIVGDVPGTARAPRGKQQRHRRRLLRNASLFEIFHCKICSFKCSDHARLVEHMNAHALERTRRPDTVRCPHCPLAFPGLVELKQHLQRHLRERHRHRLPPSAANTDAWNKNE